jgi:uncharacterized NAD-dependent epimerase/dehydratase family protein
MSEPSPRYLILAEGCLGIFSAKTAVGLVRYRPESVVAVLDSSQAGRNTRDLLDTEAAVPVVATLEAGIARGANTLLIGIAPQGGALPEEWRSLLRRALERRLSVTSGLHTFLADDPELSAAARQSGARIVDLRRPPEAQPIASLRARRTRARRILTVGTDCNVGKMVAALEIARSAAAHGLDARFLATGQTGILVAGEGIPLDRIPGDFMAGSVEDLVLRHAEADLVVVEGQGCLLHPAYAGVTLALLHGSLPDAMVLVHHAGRERLRYQEVDMPPLSEWVRRYEDALAPLHSGRVTGIAINPYGLAREQAAEAVTRAEVETGLPAVDVLRQGADRLLEGVVSPRRN